MKTLLQKHRRQQILEQHVGLAEGLVFPSDSGTYRTTSALYKTLKLIGQAADINFNVGPQVLRRTFNTLLVEEGVDQVVLRSQMGHSSAAMTERYAGIHIERKQSAVQKLIDITGCRFRGYCGPQVWPSTPKKG